LPKPDNIDIEVWEHKQLGAILQPKPIDEIVKDIFENHGNGVNWINKLCNMMNEYHWESDKSTLIAILASNQFYPMMNNGVIFRTACSYDRHIVVKMLLQRGMDPTFDNNLPLRLCYHHNSLNSIKTLLLDERVVKKLEKSTYKKLKNIYL